MTDSTIRQSAAYLAEVKAAFVAMGEPPARAEHLAALCFPNPKVSPQQQARDHLDMERLIQSSSDANNFFTLNFVTLAGG